MKILSIGNRHKEPKLIIEYGCICPTCGIKFIFDSKDVLRPRCVSDRTEDYQIKCPHCGIHVGLHKCEKFMNDVDKQRFERYIDAYNDMLFKEELCT